MQFSSFALSKLLGEIGYAWQGLSNPETCRAADNLVAELVCACCCCCCSMVPPACMGLHFLFKTNIK